MLVSRGLHLLRLSNLLKKPQNARLNLQSKRMSHVEIGYRCEHPPPLRRVITAEILGGFMWWWLLWFFWHDYKHLTGEWPWPDASKWTDKELGIPPEDED